MSELTADKAIANRQGALIVHKVAQGVQIFAGALIVRNSNKYAAPGYEASDLIALGIAMKGVDNRLGANGAQGIEVDEGTFQFFNSTALDEITFGDIGEVAYIVDDATVARTSNGNSRSIAGTIKDVDEFGVWVEIRNLRAVAEVQVTSDIFLLNAILSGTTNQVRVDNSNITADSIISPAWGVNANWPIGQLFISEKGDGYCIVNSTAEETDDKNIVLTISNA